MRKWKNGFRTGNEDAHVAVKGNMRKRLEEWEIFTQYNDSDMANSPSKSSSSKKSRTSGRGGLSRTSGPVTGTSRKISRRSGQTPRSSGSKKTPAASPGFGNISPERKLDITGAVLALVGLLTVLSLFSARNGTLTGYWIRGLQTAFGWGVYILPVGLIIVGAWLVARNVERLPVLSIERIVGICLLFLGLLVAFHWLDGPAVSAIKRAEEGTGGGYIGALVQQSLVHALGDAGTAILLAAWLVIALAMTLDLSLQEMFQWAVPLIQRIKTRVGAGLKRLFSGGGQGTVPEDMMPADPSEPERPPDNFIPISPTGVNANLPPGVTIKTNQPAQAAHIWVLPKISEILDPPQAPTMNNELVEKRALLIEETLASFGAPGKVVAKSIGPTVTMFGVEPLFVESRNGQTRVRVAKIAALADDLALALAAPRIRIQAPVPGRGYVGIEVPNEEMTLVALREVVESDAFGRNKTPLRFALGKDVAGHPKVANLDSMPHMLIAGTTGSGKSVCVNAILSCLLLNNTPDNLRLILVDPKRVELTGYNGVPHLLAPVVVEIERVIGALQWMTREMDKRYHSFAEVGARNIVDYNSRVSSGGGRKLPYLLVVIDELADLMMIAPDETERTLTRLAQLARATGIHMILATQRPSVDVVTGLIKANFPARIAFAVASNTDSRVILDQPGAERLLGRGDMLYQAPDAPAPVRLQGVFVSDTEITRLVDYWRQQAGAASPYTAAGGQAGEVDGLPQGVPLKQVPMFEDITAIQGDPLLTDAIDTVRREGRASVSMLQRRMRIGYTRAARLVDTMEEKGIVGPPSTGTGVREVLDYGEAGPPKED
jgi:S-DNA-T family DNA segregation ATPase FtsK/SpoIIIE